MEIDWVGIEKLEISLELKRAGYRRPTSFDVARVSDVGPLSPCIVRRAKIPGNYQILSNAYIWLAIQQAGLYEVPISIVDPVDKAELKMYISADAGESVIDRAGRYQTWLTENPESSVEDLASLENCTRSSVAHIIRLLKLDAEIQNLLLTGSITGAHGKELLKVKNLKKRLELARSCSIGNWSVRFLKNKISPNTSVSPSGDNEDLDIAREEKLLSERVGSKVSIDHERGRVTINYGSKEKGKQLKIYDGIRKRLLSSSDQF